MVSALRERIEAAGGTRGEAGTTVVGPLKGAHPIHRMIEDRGRMVRLFPAPAGEVAVEGAWLADRLHEQGSPA